MKKLGILVGPFLLALAISFTVAQGGRGQSPPDHGNTLCPLLLVPRHLDLTPAQRQRVEELSREFQEQCVLLRSGMRERRRELFHLLAAPRPDEAAIAARTGEIAGLQSALQQRMVRHLLAVKQVLTPEQQRKLFRLLDEAMRQDTGRME